MYKEQCYDVSDMDQLLKCYNRIPTTALNNHAPEKEKTITVRPAVSWYDENVKTSKCIRRKVERT